MTKLDPRLHAVLPGLADKRLKGMVDADQFADGQCMQIAVPLASVHRLPQADAVQVTQALMGETARVFSQHNGWAWAQLERDGYVGYVKSEYLSQEIVEPTHRIAVPSTFLYPEPNLKSQPAVTVTMNAQVAVAGGDGKFARIADGRFVFSAHLKSRLESESDFVAVAEMFKHVPYYWGGKSVHGLDCSGLVQLALEACGVACRRDSDMQEETLGSRVMVNDLDGLKRGDLVFWNGHVGIMSDAETLLHANGHHMMTVSEPLRAAAERIAQRHGHVTSIRRFQ